MMDNITKPVEHITKISVPFDDVFTSVFVIDVNGKTVLFDSATTKYDVDKYIVPALDKLGVTPDILVSSHHHADHMGGEQFLAIIYPGATRAKYPKLCEDMSQKRALSDGNILFSAVETVHLPGHCSDAIALFDKRTKTLVSADCLQLCGVGSYGTGLENAAEYLESIRRLREMDIENIITSHEYVPLGSCAFGRDAVEQYLDECEAYVFELAAFIMAHRELSFDEISELYNSENPHLPPISAYSFRNIAENI